MNIEEIGKYILKLRKEKGLTQAQLADKLFVTNKAVSRWERGLSIPEVETLYLLSEEFNVSINDILNAGVKEKEEITTYYHKKRLKEMLPDIIIILLMIIIPTIMIFIVGNISAGIMLAVYDEYQDVHKAGSYVTNFINSYTISFIIAWILLIISYIGFKFNKKIIVIISMIASILIILLVNLPFNISLDATLQLIVIITNIVELIILKKKKGLSK